MTNKKIISKYKSEKSEEENLSFKDLIYCLKNEKTDLLNQLQYNGNKSETKDFNNILSSIVGFTVGDALGVPVEFKSRQKLESNPLKEMIGYGFHKVPEGTWSDDSSMMLATMDSIIEKKDIDYNDIMKKFCDWYADSKYTATGITFDIGISTSKALQKFYNGLSALECGGNREYDNGNGSLMRLLPIVLYSSYNNLNEEQEIELISNSSSLTHNHEISKLGCKIYTDFVKSLLKGQTKAQAFNDILSKDYSEHYSNGSINYYKRLLNIKFPKLSSSEINSSGFIVDTLEASIWCLLTTSSYENAVVKAINLGNDTDTIGAITGSMAGILYGYESIPKRWISKLKNKEYLFSLINKFDETLINLKYNENSDAKKNL